MLKNRIIFNTPFKTFIQSSKSNNNNNTKQIEINNNNNNIDKNKIYQLYLNLDNDTYGIYHLYDDKKRDMGIIRFKTFEEFNSLKKYKTTTTRNRPITYTRHD